MHILRQQHKRPYVCASCTRRIAATFVRSRHDIGSAQPAIARLYSTARLRPSIIPRFTPGRYIPSRPSSYDYSTAKTTRGSLRVAIIGSGPAGFYTAYRLLSKVQDVVVDMYEQLPVPYGLVRFGVAPDHPEVKNCQDTFEEVAQSPRFNYVGNVHVGRDIDLSTMKPHYDAMLFSYGASEDRKLGIPGEDLPGVYSAREFVGWYNGLPEFQGLRPQLQAGEQALVIGQGNVALDVARILLTPVDALRNTDITEHAIQTLSDSRVRSVRIVGRRGPVQAAFTVKEARELMHIPPVAFEPIDPSLYPPDIKKLPRVQKRIAEVLLKGTKLSPRDSPKSWALDFLKAPISMNAESTHLSSVTFRRQQFAEDADPFNNLARVVPTDEEITMKASLAFRSVGYKSTPLAGLLDFGVPFDTKMGIIPNDIHGRVISPSLGPGNLTAGHMHGLYCAGWVKRGPTGVIASTMQDAFTSADVIAHDWQADVPFLNDVSGGSGSTGLGWDSVKEKVIAKGIRPLSWADWKRIDEVERARGRSKGKEREKFVSVEEMLAMLDA
ncbi:NADPH:adrenodoxin oxidoreductase mitochondrial precursor [Cucurbitaria berberidis CBS 394.84]|uniref:NADPH:adrenodoxin oxidoreductase, mitochondrial n=1 Tax=Cucurbitaria berberidis CBS 394.84 TaxID=1168544 RepID=A0A9P4GSX4_9PLEO|nr:NADPH:adrenodoxin oxidoreductase mitochondrial precursor [Cucurbitaria berberidis CBS 394.84]KAF1850750.1 NADPH:adrenodoxin oxidoreductase mitochondrial precursor [Cucurbitaria berberidis CBS 394.84]